MALKKDILIVNDDPSITTQITDLLDERKASYVTASTPLLLIA